MRELNKTEMDLISGGRDGVAVLCLTTLMLYGAYYTYSKFQEANEKLYASELELAKYKAVFGELPTKLPSTALTIPS